MKVLLVLDKHSSNDEVSAFIDASRRLSFKLPIMLVCHGPNDWELMLAKQFDGFLSLPITSNDFEWLDKKLK